MASFDIGSEPGTATLLGGGLVGLAGIVRRKTGKNR
jgi:hypothetical protein